VTKGQPAAVSFASSSLPTDASAALAEPAERIGECPAPLPQGALVTGSRPRLVVSGHAEHAESASAGSPSELSAPPMAVSGRLSSPGEEDRFVIPVPPGSRLRFEVQARRLGSPLDGVLSIRRDGGGQIAANDDQESTSDPGVDVNVPGDVSKVVASVKDLLGRGGDDFVYRLEVIALAKPDFQLTASEVSVNPPAGGAAVLTVEAARRGHNGPIQLAVEGLPPGVEVSGGEIVAGLQKGLIALVAPSAEPAASVATIIGRSGDATSPIERTALAPETAATRAFPWMRQSLGIGVTQPAPIALAWHESTSEKLVLGTKARISLALSRQAGAESPVRVRLVTTQTQPKKKVKKDNQEVEVDDVDRTLRLETEAIFGPGAADPAVTIITPPDLPPGPWDLALVAELLSADQKQVLASTATRVRRFTTQSPLTLELASASEIEARAGEGETGKLVGRVVRSEGFASPVTVTLAGLPADYPAPKIELPADQAAFELPVTFPFGAKPGKLENVRVVAQSQIDPQNAELKVTSAPATITVNVVPGEKPAEPPK
jgi:hypothetical protein